MILTQGLSEVVKVTGIVDADGDPLDVTGWAVAAALVETDEAGQRCDVVAEWSTTPTGDQGQATAVGSTVTLTITPAMSSAWTWRRGVLQAEITEPAPSSRTGRVIDEVCYLDPETVIF